MPDDSLISRNSFGPSEGPFTGLITSGLVPGAQQQPQQRVSGFMGAGGKIAYLGDKLLEGIQRGKMLSYMASEAKKQAMFKGQMGEIESQLAGDVTPEQRSQLEVLRGQLFKKYYQGETGGEQGGKKGKGGSPSGGGKGKGKDAEHPLGHIKGILDTVINRLGGPDLPKSGDVSDDTWLKAKLQEIGAPNRSQQIQDKQTSISTAVKALSEAAQAEGRTFSAEEAMGSKAVQEQMAALNRLTGDPKKTIEIVNQSLAGVPGLGTEAYYEQAAGILGGGAPAPQGPPAAPAYTPAPWAQPPAQRTPGAPPIANAGHTGEVSSARMSIFERAKWVSDRKQMEYIDRDGKQQVGPATKVNIPGRSSAWYVADANGNYYAPDQSKIREVSTALVRPTNFEQTQEQADAAWRREHRKPESYKLSAAEQADARVALEQRLHPSTDPNAPTGELKNRMTAERIISEAKDPKAVAAAKGYLRNLQLVSDIRDNTLQTRLGTGNKVYDEALENMVQAPNKEAARAALPTKVGLLTDQLLRYQLPPATAYSLERAGEAGRNPAAAAAYVAAGFLNPDWSPMNYDQRRRTVLDFAPSGQGGQNARAWNTAVGHLKSLYDAAGKVDNTKLKLVNSARMLGLTQVSDPDIANLKKDILPVVQDMVRAITGKSASIPEQRQWEAALDGSWSKEALQSVIKDLIGNTLMVRAQALNGQYQSIMGKPAGDLIITPYTQRILREFGVDFSDIVGSWFDNTGTGPQGPPAAPKVNPNQYEH